MQFDESDPDSEPLTNPDTDNATHFNYQEAPDDQEGHYRKLHQYNTGMRNGEWIDQELGRKIDALNLYDCISSTLELTPYQKERGRHLVDRINIRKIGNDTKAVILCLCAIVVREDGRIYHPNRSNQNNDPFFITFAQQLTLSEAALKSCYNRVATEIER